MIQINSAFIQTILCALTSLKIVEDDTIMFLLLLLLLLLLLRISDLFITLRRRWGDLV